MRKKLDTAGEIERSINTVFRPSVWTKFIKAVKEFKMINAGDKIAVCISGGKDSMLLAKLMQMLHKISDVPFEIEYISMDPGYNEKNRKKIEENAEKIGIPIKFFETDIFDVTAKVDGNPCYLCARMRRGHLYAKAKELGCNKIALGHHKNDVIETTVMGMLFSGQIQGMLPKLKSTNFEGMELIRPLYYVGESDIIKWRDRNELEFIACACKLTAGLAKGDENSARLQTKQIIEKLSKEIPDVEEHILK
ncbi:MAG: hypothetical protein IJA23_03805, partial [Clostridia bacterium]|nr:hypothetical protein [Clostridia bacterium]